MTAPSRPRYVATVARLAGYRKLIAFGIVAVCGTVLQAIGSFDPTIAAFLGGSFLTYVGGNVREHAHRARAAAEGPSTGAGQDTDPPAPRAGRLTPRPGGPAPFDRVEPSDRTEFDPERPAVDRETMIVMLADMMAERLAQRPEGGR